MRERIIASSRIEFSKAGYDEIGIRELAQAAGVDPAIVIRTCGSKQELFAAVADRTFAFDEGFEVSLDEFGTFLARHLVGKMDGEDGLREEQDFNLLLRSAASHTAGPILAAGLQAKFVAPLARIIGGEDAEMKAALLTACTLGYATMRVALCSEVLNSGDREVLAERLGRVLQSCLS
jgi:AcrR family transcriptional regulator